MRDCDWPRNGSAGRRNGYSAYYNRILYHKKAALPMRDFMPRDGCNFGTELLYWGKRIKILQMRSLDDILSAKRGAAPVSYTHLGAEILQGARPVRLPGGGLLLFVQK